MTSWAFSKRRLLPFLWHSLWLPLAYAAVIAVEIDISSDVPLVPLRAACVHGPRPPFFNDINEEYGALRGHLRSDILRRIDERVRRGDSAFRSLMPVKTIGGENYVPKSTWQSPLFEDLAIEIVGERLGLERSEFVNNANQLAEGISEEGTVTCDAMQALLVEGGAWAESGPHRVVPYLDQTFDEQADDLVRPVGLPAPEFEELPPPRSWLPNYMFILAPWLFFAFIADRAAVWFGLPRWPSRIAAGLFGPIAIAQAALTAFMLWVLIVNTL
ncbi:MAG: hypothetical protein HOH66_01925 [Rhodospirillaceae bacterium]|nr:hypothetical protein [Rhodospirillaceae bacterium]